MSGSQPPAQVPRETGASAAASFPVAPLLMALLAAAALLATLDPAGTYPALHEGPGITFDEVFNVEMGVYHWRALRDRGLDLWFDPPTRQRIFGQAGYNPDHPPLGRLGLGLAHDLVLWLAPPHGDPGPLVTACARSASPLAFAVTVLLAGWCAQRWYGRAAGFVAAAALVLMPRVFAHAHLAALETCMGLSFSATVLYVADRWGAARIGTAGRESRPAGCAMHPGLGVAVVAGLLWGLALLTKIQAVLVPLPIAAWALWRWRLRAVIPLAVLGIVGGALFIVGWPWIWLDPLANLRAYFARTTVRPTLYCWYLGVRYADRDVPWHYPFVMFTVSVPLGLQALGGWGLWRTLRRRMVSMSGSADDRVSQGAAISGADPRGGLVAVTVLWVLAFFALPGITVYDGTRLFLVVYPLWAVLIGKGGAGLLRWASQRWSPFVARTLLGLLLAAQSYGVIALHPCQLSYYNLCVGGLRGAARLGFEPTYWGDSVTRSFLTDIVRQVPAGSTIDVAPVLHPFQLDDLLAQSPILRNHNIRLRAYDHPHAAQVRYALVIRRHADPWKELSDPPPNSRTLAEVRREGVQLAVLYEMWRVE